MQIYAVVSQILRGSCGDFVSFSTRLSEVLHVVRSGTLFCNMCVCVSYTDIFNLNRSTRST